MENSVSFTVSNAKEAQLALILAILGRPENNANHVISYPSCEEAVAYIEKGQDFEGSSLSFADIVGPVDAKNLNLKALWDERWKKEVA